MPTSNRPQRDAWESLKLAQGVDRWKSRFSRNHGTLKAETAMEKPTCGRAA